MSGALVNVPTIEVGTVDEAVAAAATNRGTNCVRHAIVTTCSTPS
jgi:hypothetical protein